MSEPRERWQSRTRFILAAVGCAVGLGNVWRFPYVAYTSGGGAFMIPYVVALVTAGVPLLVLEYAIGQRYQKAAPGALKSVNPKMEWVGWWAAGVSMVIVVYYAVIMAWACDYFVYSFRLEWGREPGKFFLEQFLKVSSGPGVTGELNLPVFAGLLATWLAIYWTLNRGIERVGKVVLWSVPIPLILLLNSRDSRNYPSRRIGRDRLLPYTRLPQVARP